MAVPDPLLPLPDVPARRRTRDLVALTMMCVGVLGVIVMLFVIDARVGALALFAAVGGLGVVMGLAPDTDKT